MSDPADIKRLLDAATPGPWEMDTEQSIRVERSNRKWLSYHWSETTFGKHDESALRKVREANAALIAAAPTIAAAYIEQAATIEALTAALRTTQAALRKSMIEPYESGNVDCWHCHVCDTQWDRISGERHAPSCPAATESTP